MAASIPTTEPSSLRAGDTWQWRREDLTADFPASGGWSLKYYFRNASAKFDITATADGDAFAVAVPKATTAARARGDYDWIAVVESATERYEIDRGMLEVEHDYATDAVYDDRSFARRMLDAIEAALLNRASSDQLDMIDVAMADRKLSRDKAGLITLRSQFKAEAKREEQAANGISSSRVMVRFKNA
jgi:hypothetical protein